MADFTADEIQAAVEQIVQSSITRTYDSLGVRRQDVSFNQIQTAAAGIFILYPLAPFYCVFLGAQRLLESIAGEVAVVDQLVEGVSSLSRLVLDVEDLSPLHNAQAALQALSSAVSGGAPADITKLPQYQRYTSNVNTFLAGPASAVKQNGAIVPTPPEARANIPSLLSQLQQAHVATVEAATLLAGSIVDFSSINLSALVAQGIINNASSVLAKDTAALNALPAAQRLSAIRTPILNLIAAKSVITTFGSFTGPSAFYSITGQGRPYSDALHLATPAVLRATKGPPYNVQSGVNDILTFTLDGAGPTVSVILPSSRYATLAATIVEAPPAESGSVDGYLIGDGTHPTGLPTGTTVPTNNLLHFKISGQSFTDDIVVPLTVCNDGPTVQRRTAQNIADDINAVLVGIVGTALIAEPYFYPTVHFQGALNVTPTGGSDADFTMYVPGASSFAVIAVGDIIVVSSGPNADIYDVMLSTSTTISATARTITPTLQTNQLSTVGPRDRAVRFRAVEPATVDEEWTITIFGESPIVADTATTLGFGIGYSVTSAPEEPSDIVSAVNQQQRRVTASSVVDAGPSFSCYTDPNDPFHVTASRYQGTATLSFGSGQITLTGFTGLVAAGVLDGDTVVLRGQNNSSWTVFSHTDTQLVAFGSATPTTGPGVAFEVGPPLDIFEWKTLQITTGPNRGNYVVAGEGVSPIDILLRLRSPIGHYVDQATLQPVVQNAVLGIEYLTFASPTATISSSVAVAGTGVSLIWSSPPAPATGSTPYFFIPRPSAGGVPTADDLLELFPTSYASPSAIYTVTTVDQITGGFVVGVRPDIPDLPSSWAFGPIPPPYAALRHGHVVDFQSFQTALANWLSLPAQQTTLFFQAVNRTINPLLANTNPSAASVGTAKSQLLQLGALLSVDIAQQNNQFPSSTLESILKNYVVDSVSQIDTLIKTYRAQGADAAIDVLIGGQFSSFFSLTQDGTSYAGQMQAAMRAVAQNDLPVRRVNRINAVQARQIGSAQSPDYEFSQEDTEANLKPDAPADFEKTTGSQ